MKASFPKAVLSFAVLALLAVPLEARAGLFSDSWRYKMTVEVETPEGLKTGSAVREVTTTRLGGLINPQMGSVKVQVQGEAVAVDLGKRGILFALMDSDGSYHAVYDAFPAPPQFNKGTVSKYYKSLGNAKATLKVLQYPTFVFFRDQNDPKTIQNVRVPNDPRTDAIRKEDPYRPIVDIERAFGKGVAIKDVTLEITKEPVTWGIEKYLPWVLTVGGGTLSGKRIDIGPEWYDSLNVWEFKREQK
jgi:hypothetical protein